MQGDDLAIFLFWATLSVAFGVEAVKAETAPRRIAFGTLAGLFLLIGLTWIELKKVWPPLTEWVTSVATDPTAWFVLFIFIAAVFAFHNPKNKEKPAAAGNFQRAIAALEWPKVEKWFSPSAALDEFVERPLLQKALSLLNTTRGIQQEIADARAARAKEHPGEFETIMAMAKGDSHSELISGLQTKLTDAEVSYSLARREVFSNLIQQLKNGTLIAKGLPFENKKLDGDWEFIKPAYWSVLTFDEYGDGALETVSGGGRVYKGLQIGKQVQHPEIASPKISLLKRLLYRN